MRHFGLLAVSLLLAGCATIANDPREKIPVRSEPAGAVVTVDCGSAPMYGGVTPAVIIIERTSDPCAITVAKDGFAEQHVDLQRTISASTAGNAVPGAVLGAITGIFAAFLEMDRLGGEDTIESAASAGYHAGKGAADAVDRKTGAAYKHVPGEVFVRLDPLR